MYRTNPPPVLRCPIEPRLLGLVSVFIMAIDASTEPFSASLTRVPCVGELIFREEKCYCVMRVYHAIVDHKGYTQAGTHGFVDVQEVPEPVISKRRPTAKRQVRARRKRR